MTYGDTVVARSGANSAPVAVLVGISFPRYKIAKAPRLRKNPPDLALRHLREAIARVVVCRVFWTVAPAAVASAAFHAFRSCSNGIEIEDPNGGVG